MPMPTLKLEKKFYGEWRNHNDAVGDFMLLCHDTNIIMDVASTGALQKICKDLPVRNMKSTFIKNLLCK